MTSTPIKEPGVSIIVPAYNEEAAIGPVLQGLHSVLRESHISQFEIVVVDDGSSDQTRPRLLDLRASLPELRVLHHAENRGYGAALKTGLRAAQHDLICITDADGTYPSEAIPQLFTTLLSGQYDMVVGARTGAEVHIPPLRRPAKRFIAGLMWLLTGHRIPDFNSGLRVFRRSVARRFSRMLPDGFSFTTTITLAMLQSRYRVAYHSINYHARTGQSKIRPVRDTLNFIFLIVRATVYFAPLRIFAPLSFILLMSGVLIGLISHFLLGRLMDVTTIIFILTALQVALSGLLADMIDKRIPDF